MKRRDYNSAHWNTWVESFTDRVLGCETWGVSAHKSYISRHQRGWGEQITAQNASLWWTLPLDDDGTLPCIKSSSQHTIVGQWSRDKISLCHISHTSHTPHVRLSSIHLDMRRAAPLAARCVIFGPKVSQSQSQSQRGRICNLFVKLYWNLFWTSPGFVSFGTNMIHYGAYLTRFGIIWLTLVTNLTILAPLAVDCTAVYIATVDKGRVTAPGMSNLASKIGSDWPQMEQIWEPKCTENWS